MDENDEYSISLIIEELEDPELNEKGIEAFENGLKDNSGKSIDDLKEDISNGLHPEFVAGVEAKHIFETCPSELIPSELGKIYHEYTVSASIFKKILDEHDHEVDQDTTYYEFAEAKVRSEQDEEDEIY